MKKGITPIIAIIILLLITIGLSAMAWTYLSGFLSGYTKSLQLVDSYCMGATTANVILRNAGPDPIAFSSCSNDNNVMTCGSLTITRTDTGGTFSSNTNITQSDPSTPNIEPGETLTFKDICTTSGPKVCTYRFISGGTGATVVSIPCG